jgi:hypothetical protein
VRWRDWAGSGIEHLVLTETATGTLAEAVLLSGVADGFAARYRVEIDRHWRVRRAVIAIVGAAAELNLRADGAGRWTDGDGRPLTQLDGAIDLDLSASPFTNTLPIRRLGLAIGESADIVTAYVALPGLAPAADPQRYTRLGPRRWRYESRDGGFVREIEVDDGGLVMTYPGLFRRIA